MSLRETTAIKGANLQPNGRTAAAVATRENIFAMTQNAEDAVLRPADCGAFSHEMRAGIAARVSRLAGDEILCAQYLSAAGDQASLAQTDSQHDMQAVLTFVDKVANQTRDVAAEDISALQSAGISDADIVRLCELVAFLAYQLRVISGLRLMQGEAS